MVKCSPKDCRQESENSSASRHPNPCRDKLAAVFFFFLSFFLLQFSILLYDFFFVCFFSRGHQGQALPWVDGSIFRFATLIDLTKLSSLGFGGLGGDNYSLMEFQVGFREQGQCCCCQAGELCKQCRRSRGGWNTRHATSRWVVFFSSHEWSSRTWQTRGQQPRGGVTTGEPLRPFTKDQFDF